MAIEDLIARSIVPEFESSLDAQKRYMSLRDLVDQRRVRDLQVRRLELQEQEAKREAEENEQYRRGLGTLPANANLQQTVQALGPKGIAYFTADRQARQAGIGLEKAQAELGDVRIKARGRNAQALYKLAPEKRADAAKELTENMIRDRILDASARNEPLELDDESLLNYHRQAYGAKETQDFLDGITKSAAEAEAAKQKKILDAFAVTEKQWGQSGHLLGSVAGDNPQALQETWTRFLKALPPDAASLLNPTYSPDEKKRAESMHLSALQRVQEARAQTTAAAQDAAHKATATGQILTQAGKLRDDYARESKNYVIVRDAFEAMRQAAKLDTGPGDLAVVFQSFRLQDPGSTVSTGEQASAAGLATLPDQLRVWAQRLIDGKTARLPAKVRDEFIALGQAKFGQMTGTHKQITDFFSESASRNNINPRDVLIPYTPDEIVEQGRQQASGQGGPAPVAGAPAQQPATVGGVPNPIMKPGEVLVKAPDGKTYSFPSAAAADVFKKRAGIK